MNISSIALIEEFHFTSDITCSMSAFTLCDEIIRNCFCDVPRIFLSDHHTWKQFITVTVLKHQGKFYYLQSITFMLITCPLPPPEKFCPSPPQEISYP